MRATILLAIGLLFLCLAIMGIASIPLLERSNEPRSISEAIPAITVEAPTVAPASTGTVTPAQEPTGTSNPTATLMPTTTPAPTLTTTATAGTPVPYNPPPPALFCDHAALFAHVTIPDGTVLFPGTMFTKTWRLQNVGSCVWNPYYQLVFVSGDQMGAPLFMALPGDVRLGQTVDISLNLTAPSAAGSYRGYWMLRSSTGTLFGTGPQADEPWSVDIQVSGPTTTPGGPTLTPGGLLVTPRPGTPQPTPIVIDMSAQLVEAEWPTRIKVGQSGTIRVSLVKEGEGYTPAVELTGSGNTAIAATFIAVGTPGVEPRQAFGGEYEAYAVAKIAGAAFEISSASPEWQSLDQSRVDWIWNIASDNSGMQGVDVSVEIEWRPVDQVGESLRRTIWRSHLEIEVYQPILAAGQISALSLLSAFLGSGLSIPWLYEMISKRKTQRRRKEKKRA